MIVVCSTCQARFKVADEKIGPRGAKVRCSKCQTVFIVHKELGVMPVESQPVAAPSPPALAAPPPGAIDLDLEGAQGRGLRPNGFAANPYSRPDRASTPAPAADPFGSADPFQDPAAAPPPAQAADPFTAPDPFTEPSGGGFGAVDPFVASVASPAPGLPTSAVTDLSDLLGSVAPPEPPPAPPPTQGSTPPTDPVGVLDSGFDFDTAAGSELGLEVESRPPPEYSPSEPSGVGSDLALDERTPAPGIAVPPMPGFGNFAGADPFENPSEAMPAPSGQVDFDGFGGGEEVAPAPAPAFHSPFSPMQEDAPVPSPEPLPSVAVETTGEGDAVAGAFRRNSRFRIIAVNAISLVALLAVALALLALWRGLRPGSGGLLRPTAMLGAIGGEAERFTTTQLRSGIYDRPDAPPLLFVSGAAVSHATGPVTGLRVRVELVRRGAVIARGEARAGAVPTPEELCATRDPAALAASLERIASKGPQSLKPGESLPFLVAIAEYPADVAGAALRVALEPAEPVVAPAPAPEEALPLPPAAGSSTPTPEGTRRP